MKENQCTSERIISRILNDSHYIFGSSTICAHASVTQTWDKYYTLLLPLHTFTVMESTRKSVSLHLEWKWYTRTSTVSISFITATFQVSHIRCRRLVSLNLFLWQPPCYSCRQLLELGHSLVPTPTIWNDPSALSLTSYLTTSSIIARLSLTRMTRAYVPGHPVVGLSSGIEAEAIE